PSGGPTGPPCRGRRGRRCEHATCTATPTHGPRRPRSSHARSWRGGSSSACLSLLCEWPRLVRAERTTHRCEAAPSPGKREGWEAEPPVGATIRTSIPVAPRVRAGRLPPLRFAQHDRQSFQRGPLGLLGGLELLLAPLVVRSAVRTWVSDPEDPDVGV